MNVVINQTVVDLSSASARLAGAAHMIANREVLTGDDLSALKRVIASTRATLDRVEAEVTASRTGLTTPSASWDDRNDIAAERAASKGAA